MTSANRSPNVGADAPLTLTEKSKPSNPYDGRLADTRMPGRVVAPPAIGIAQRLVRFGDLAELRRRHAVARVDVRMKPPRQPLVGALDLADASRPARVRGQCRSPSNLRIAEWRIAFVDNLRIDDIALSWFHPPALRRRARLAPRRRQPPARRCRSPRPRAGARLLAIERLGRLVLRRGQLIERALDFRRVVALDRLFRPPPSPTRSPTCRQRASLSPVSFSMRSAP